MKKIKYIILSIFSLATLFSCSDREDIRNDIDNLNARLAQLEAKLPQINENITLYQGLINDKYMIVGYAEDKDGDYILDLSNGESFEVKVHAGGQPTLSIGADGYWYYTYSNGVAQLLVDENGNPVNATLTPQFMVDSNGYWQYSFGNDVWLGGIGEADPNKTLGSLFNDVDFKDGKLILTWSSNGQTLTKEIPLFEGLELTITDLKDVNTPIEFSVGQTRTWVIEQGPKVDRIVIETIDWIIKIDETSMTVTAPKKNLMGEDYNDKLVLKIFSKEGYCRAVTVPVKLLNSIIDGNSATAWQNFLLKNERNVLLDYSYAGYKHGLIAPPDVSTLSGYTTVNIKEYKEKNGIENYRLALNRILYDYKLVRKCPGKTDNNNSNANANLIVYFPEGEYVLQDGTETEIFPQIIGGNFVIKGAGTGVTKIKMTGLNDKLNKPLLNISHTNSPTNVTNSPLLATVNANAKKGDFTVKVNNTAGITTGKWVQLRLRSGNEDLIASELGDITPGTTWSINTQPTVPASGNEDTNGVRIFEFHQVKSVGNGTITFEEPIMHDINIAYNDCGGWQIREYKYHENVGVEDITFEGNCIAPYMHHGPGNGTGADDWQYDEGYRPLQFGRVVNSWVRNVNFVSVSEAVTFGESANCSAYNIQITGNRGHSAVRAQNSSRVFIGKVLDDSEVNGVKGHGQWHGCGVSKPSIGTVIWNSTWGKDACFESHASQPRATLFDNCKGGLVKYHAGGAEKENPNHLADLTIWNLNVTGTIDEKGINFASNFNWWSNIDPWWKIYPPILVGVHGLSITWDNGTDVEKQYTYEESTGKRVTPESLYEAQLRNRLGYVPSWLSALK